MTSPLTARKLEALENVTRNLSRRGYRVIRAPGPDELPAFLAGTQPDAIATGTSPSIVLEVMTREGPPGANKNKILEIRERVEQHRPDWSLHVVYAPVVGPQLLPGDKPSIAKRLDEVEKLAVVDRPAALLLGWSLLEAAGRLLLPEQLVKPSGAGSLVSLLTSMGHLEQDQARSLDRLVDLRNSVAHGDVDAEVEAADVAEVLGATRGLLDPAEWD